MFSLRKKSEIIILSPKATHLSLFFRPQMKKLQSAAASTMEEPPAAPATTATTWFELKKIKRGAKLN